MYGPEPQLFPTDNVAAIVIGLYTAVTVWLDVTLVYTPLQELKTYPVYPVVVGGVALPPDGILLTTACAAAPVEDL